MKDKTAITLSSDVLADVDRLAGLNSARELEQLNRAAEHLNSEVADVLEYQSPWPAE